MNRSCWTLSFLTALLSLLLLVPSAAAAADVPTAVPDTGGDTQLRAQVRITSPDAGVVQFSIPVLNLARTDRGYVLSSIVSSSDLSKIVQHSGTGAVGFWNPISQAYIYGDLDTILLPALSYFVELSSPLTTLDLGSTGFWISGLSIHEGWNMFGAITQEQSWNNCQHPPVDSGPWSWDGEKYVQSSTLTPVSGYWIHATADGELVVPSPSGSSAGAGEIEESRLPQAGPMPPSWTDGPVFRGFDDVAEEHWARREVREMVWRAVVGGYSIDPPLFGPGDPLTRAEMAAMLCRAYRIPGADSAEPSFDDVSPEHWAYRYVEALYAADIVQGYANDPDGPPAFRPDAVVTRDQMAVFLARTQKLEPMEPTEALFADVPADFWAAPAIAALKAAGITQGYPGDPPTYGPQEAVTRAQMCVFLSRALSCPPSS